MNARPPVQQRARGVEDEIRLGGPARDFGKIGRQQLIVLLENGLQPWSKILDFGCGALRAGWWLMHFLDAGCYHGIEPDRRKVEVAAERICGPDLIEQARPRFRHATDLDMAAFGVAWDFVLARSIWTHASKAEIAAMLSQFADTAAPGGRMLASVLPAGEGREDYMGDHGLRSGDTPGATGLLAHDPKWVRGQASKLGLRPQVLTGRVANEQVWMRFDR